MCKQLIHPHCIRNVCVNKCVYWTPGTFMVYKEHLNTDVQKDTVKRGLMMLGNRQTVESFTNVV